MSKVSMIFLLNVSCALEVNHILVLEFLLFFVQMLAILFILFFSTQNCKAPFWSSNLWWHLSVWLCLCSYPLGAFLFLLDQILFPYATFCILLLLLNFFMNIHESRILSRCYLYTKGKFTFYIQTYNLELIFPSGLQISWWPMYFIPTHVYMLEYLKF